MTRIPMFTLFYLATFLQAGAYGLTFMLPRLFDTFGANEKVVGTMLALTAIATLLAVYYAGHLSDRLGHMRTLGLACLVIAAALVLYATATHVGLLVVLASMCLGAGWGLTYALSPVALTRVVPDHDRVRFFALLSVAVMAGFGLSPVLAALFETAGLTLSDAFNVTALLCALAGLMFFSLTPAIRAHTLGEVQQATARLSPGAVASILKSPARLPIIMVCIGASVFAGMNNFQTVFADERGLDYADYFLAYTATVVLFRLVLARFKGGGTPYLTIAALQYVMCAAVALFLFVETLPLYLLTAFLFGIGYGVSYPILAAMAANDADKTLVPQTLQLFAFTYFIGIFGFPLIAGWMIVEMGASALLVLLAALACLEATMALRRGLNSRAVALQS